MDDNSLLFELERLFRQFSTWYRLRRGMAWLLKGLILGLALALGFSLVGVLQEGMLRDEYYGMILQFCALSGVAGILAGWAWPVSKTKLARFFDQTFALRERSSTSLELLEKIRKDPSLIHAENSLAGDQLKDTLTVSSRLHPASRFYFPATRAQVILAGSLAVGLVLLGVFGEPLFQRAFQQRQMRQAIAQEAARLEALAQQIRGNEQLSTAQREQIAKTLDEAVQKLNEAQTPEQAVAVLSSAEKQLQGLENEQALQQSEALKNAGKRLMEDNPAGADTSLQSFAQNLAEGDNLAAAQDLANLDLSNLSPEEASLLADQLEEASRALAESNPELSQQLAEAAQAIRDGNLQDAQQSLQQAAQSLANAGQQVAQAQAASQAAEQVNQGQGRLIQAGESQNEQAQGGQAGQGGQGQSSNGQPGSSSSSSGGSGAGEGESAGQEGEGAPAGSEPIEQNNQAGDGGLRPYEEIYAPQRLGGSGSDEVSLPGTGQEGDQVVGQGDTAPGDQNLSRVPYVDVLANYTEAYRQAFESGRVPVGLRALVRKYFSSLEP